MYVLVCPAYFTVILVHIRRRKKQYLQLDEEKKTNERERVSTRSAEKSRSLKKKGPKI
jgi:hypothetical protein